VADRLARTLSVDGRVRGLAIVTTELVEEARRRHGTLPTATAALGRALTSALLLAGTLKDDERLSLEFSGDGPLRGILAEANPAGDARGFVFRPRTHLPARAGKLDVGGALGQGILCVIRMPAGDGTHYRSIVPLASGEIGADVARYLVQSEQTPSAVGVGVYVEPDGRVGAAGGYLIQGMPGVTPEALDRVAAAVDAAPPPSDLARRGHAPAEVLALLLGETQLLEERPVAFRCRCDHERVTRAILAMGRAEIEDALAKDGRAEAVCEFCSERYVVESRELRALLDGTI
jgi:molecular chaperone Hsp33